MAHLPVSPAPDSYFEKEQLGTGFGKAEPAGDLKPYQRARIPFTGSFVGTPATAHPIGKSVEIDIFTTEPDSGVKLMNLVAHLNLL